MSCCAALSFCLTEVLPDDTMLPTVQLLGEESFFSHLGMDDDGAKSSVVYSLDDLPDIEDITDWEWLDTPLMDLEGEFDDDGHIICRSVSPSTESASTISSISDACEEDRVEAHIDSIAGFEESWHIV